VGFNEDRFPRHGKRVVWEVVLLSSIPPGRKVVGNRWVFTEKDDGILTSRTLAQGFSQVPGKNFFESHAQFITDIAFSLALIIWVLINLRAVPFNIKTAFF
jgi:Reverse transcriptase (RNA-dependent DNA polymerase)